MKTFMAAAAAVALVAGVSIGSAQNAGTPGAGSAGQDQRPADQELPNAAKKQPPTSDAPAGQNATDRRVPSQSGTTGVAPAESNGSRSTPMPDQLPAER